MARILVLQEDPGTDRELRLIVFDHPVEFEFRSPSLIAGKGADMSSYDAVLASMDCAGPEVIDALRRDGTKGSPVLLYRGEPPLREAARWVLWSEPPAGGTPSTMTGRLLSENLEYYSLASLYQKCLKIMTSQDEDSLLTQVTETFVRELGAESCVIWLSSPSDPDDMMIASVRGVISIDREGSRFFLSQSEIAETVWKGKPFVAATSAAGGVSSADPVPSLYVPLVYQEKPIGLVKLGERVDHKAYGESDFYIARIIADYAASSLRTVDRLVRMEKIALKDPETRAYSAAFLADYFEKERYKASRFRRPLSLIFLAVDNFSYLMEKTRESLVVGALASMVETLRKALRDSDLVARIDPSRFCIVLPETDYFGSLLAVRRLRKAVRETSSIQFLGSEYAIAPFFMSATYPRDGKDFQELCRAGDDKYVRQQKSPMHRLHLTEKSFWDAFDILVGKPEHYDLLRKGEDVPYFTRVRRDLGRNAHFTIPREMFFRMVESMAQDVVAVEDMRGLVIAAGPRPEIFKQIFLSFGSEAPRGRNIYIVGQSGSTRFDAKNLLYVSTEDEHLRDREIVLYLKEDGAYGLFATGRQDEVCGFNTADEWLVESMMEKLQELYLLQGNF